MFTLIEQILILITLREVVLKAFLFFDYYFFEAVTLSLTPSPPTPLPLFRSLTEAKNESTATSLFFLFFHRLFLEKPINKIKGHCEH